MASENQNGTDTILDIDGLKTYFFTEDGVVKAVNGVDLRVRRGETLGLVGESGCGKSVMMFSVMRLIGQPGRIVEGEISFDGQQILELSEEEMQRIRGNRISMIFQQPLSSLNPVFRVGDQIAEAFQIHAGLSKDEARKRAVEMMRLVGIPDAERRAQAFPHEISGGMRQRVMIAIALACDPRVLIADEPTTALDVTIQAQILRLMADLKAKLGTAIIFITHDLGVVAQFAQNVMVMYAGEAVEYTNVKALFRRPSHPYTLGLLQSLPDPERTVDMLRTIPGTVDQSAKRSVGCKFAPRCSFRVPKCETQRPPLMEIAPGHRARCWEWERVAPHAE
jgi:peptide/nickel transport system ATP-binding protein